jgi:hypothetical protein
MTLSLEHAVVYDIETLPNAFTLTAEMLNSEVRSTWEVSHYRDDRQPLMEWFAHLQRNGVPMISFNGIHFDYPVCHFIFHNPQVTVEQIYEKAMTIIRSNDRFGHTIWDRDRFAPQIDLFKIHHFDNVAKTTTLKALQINMRSPTVVDSPVEFGTMLTKQQVDQDLIPYNCHDVSETKRFAFFSMDAINFRIGIIPQFGIEALNYNDTKIGEKMLEQRLGDDVCYDRSSGRKVKRQSPRYRIALADIIFPYIQFNNPEFQRVLAFMKDQVLTPDDLTDPDAPIKTKGVFTDLVANVGGLDFYFGTGGVHASVTAQRFIASGDWIIRDIDVEGLYPNIAIANRLAPEHLGEAYITEYAKIPVERKTHKKGTYQNAALKLAANGSWGKSNSKFSIFYDPKYAMTIPINGQLLICMLAEWLLTVPTIQLIQANTDGITYRIHKDHEPQAAAICRQWEAFTCLKLEDADYSRMWIRDVNNYIAEPVTPFGQNEPPHYKQKGAYWHPDPFNYAESISKASPPCWYKDLGNIVSIRAANAAMIHGIDPAVYIRAHTDPFDFMCRVKVDRASKLYLGGVPIQSTTRYYVATNGAPMIKISPPPAGHAIGQWKRAPRVSKAEYDRVMAETGGQWDERVCTKAKTKYDNVTTAIQAGWQIAECNDTRSFRFDNVNYDYYIAEARKLIIG